MTDKEPTQEQIKEVWKWCGQYKECGYCTGSGRFYSALNTYSQCGACEGRGYFAPRDISLNNLFKYAVPLAIKKLESRFSALENQIRGLEIIFWKWRDKIREGYSLEDALFWVIWDIKDE